MANEAEVRLSKPIVTLSLLNIIGLATIIVALLKPHPFTLIVSVSVGGALIFLSLAIFVFEFVKDLNKRELFSPLLDALGDTVRGADVLRSTGMDVDSEALDTQRPPEFVIRTRFDSSTRRSRKRRSAGENKLLTQKGTRVKGYDLQGIMNFDSTKLVTSEMIDDIENTDFLILDFKHVYRNFTSALILILDLLLLFKEEKKTVFLTETSANSDLIEFMRSKLPAAHFQQITRYETTTEALEHCEGALVEGDSAFSEKKVVPIEENELLNGLNAEELSYFINRLEKHEYKANRTILHEGDKADGIHFLTEGEVVVELDIKGKKKIIIYRAPAGLGFGEMAIIDNKPRAASIRAETDVVCYKFNVKDFEDDRSEIANLIKMKLMRNVAASLSDKLRKSNIELSTYLLT